MPESTSTLEQVPQASKPFPWRCHKCRQKTVEPATVAYRSTIRHDDQLHTVDTPGLVVPRCTNCGELVFTDEVERQVDRVFRAQVHLLTADQIRTNRSALGLSREQLAERLGVERDLVRRWEENLVVPSRAHDNLLRLYFGLPQVRSVLVGPAGHPDFGACVVLETT